MGEAARKEGHRMLSRSRQGSWAPWWLLRLVLGPCGLEDWGMLRKAVSKMWTDRMEIQKPCGLVLEGLKDQVGRGLVVEGKGRYAEECSSEGRN